MRTRVLALLAMVACSGPTSPTEQNIPGRWTTHTSFYSQVRLTLTERPDDHQLFGYWAGVCQTGGCVDTGFVYYGSRQGSELTFGLTSASRSLAVSGTLAPDSSISASVQLTENRVKSTPEPVTFHWGR